MRSNLCTPLLAVSTAVWSSHKDNVRSGIAVEEQLKQKIVQLSEPSSTSRLLLISLMCQAPAKLYFFLNCLYDGFDFACGTSIGSQWCRAGALTSRYKLPKAKVQHDRAPQWSPREWPLCARLWVLPGVKFCADSTKSPSNETINPRVYAYAKRSPRYARSFTGSCSPSAADLSFGVSVQAVETEHYTKEAEEEIR